MNDQTGIVKRIAVTFDRLIAPVALFIATYLAVLIGLLWSRLVPFQWAALISAAVASAATIALWDRGRWDLGLFVSPRLALIECALGMLLAFALIGAGDLLILATTGVRHEVGGGFPFAQLLTVFIPAAIHEELLFRGYPFQRLWRWSRPVAVLAFSIGFALLHLWNSHITPIAVFNIFLGGVLLSLAYGRYERLWFPIGIHFAWNLMSGPILGYSVSGFGPEATLFRVTGEGPEILTGGAFGIEGSVWMTVVEIGVIVALWRGHWSAAASSAVSRNE